MPSKRPENVPAIRHARFNRSRILKQRKQSNELFGNYRKTNEKNSDACQRQTKQPEHKNQSNGFANSKLSRKRPEHLFAERCAFECVALSIKLISFRYTCAFLYKTIDCAATFYTYRYCCNWNLSKMGAIHERSQHNHGPGELNGECGGWKATRRVKEGA